MAEGFNSVGEALARAVEDKAVVEVEASLADVASQVRALNRFVEDLGRRMDAADLRLAHVETAIFRMLVASALYGVASVAFAIVVFVR